MAESLHFAIRIDLVMFQDRHLHLLGLMLDLFRVYNNILEKTSSVKDTHDIRCTPSSYASSRHHGGEAPSEEWIIFECCSH